MEAPSQRWPPSARTSRSPSISAAAPRDLIVRMVPGELGYSLPPHWSACHLALAGTRTWGPRHR